MSDVNDMVGGRHAGEEHFPDDPLLPGSAPVGAAEARAAHLASCPSCAALLAGRERIADELKALPRQIAPRAAGGALDYATILAQVDEVAFEARLAADESRVRRLLRPLVRLRAPDELRVPGLAPVRRLELLPRLAAAAAVLLVGLSAALALQSEKPSLAGGGFAAETAALSGRPVVAIRIVEVASGTPSGLPAPLRPRGGP